MYVIIIIVLRIIHLVGMMRKSDQGPVPFRPIIVPSVKPTH